MRKQDQKEMKFYHLCRRQIKNKKTPVACWRILKLKKFFDPQFEQYLERRCQKLPIEFLNLKQVKTALSNDKLGPQCRQVLKRAEAVLEYQKKDDPPLFSPRRFKDRADLKAP